jgi:acyl-coenzyme A synthetase/AMP-(fatty) acid ligase
MNVADALTRWAEETPYAVAVNDRRRLIDYRSLELAVWRAVAALHAQGVRPGDIVGISLRDSSALYLVVVYALARMGAVQVLLPPSEPAALHETLARRFRLAAVIGEDDAAPLGALPRLTPRAQWLEPGDAAVDRGLRAEGGDAPWKINRSSGTTGEPKGTWRTHRQQLVLDARTRELVGDARDDRYLALVEFGFIYGLGIAFDVINEGGSVRIIRRGMRVAEILDLIDREHINRLVLTPGHAVQLLAQLPGDAPRFPRLRTLQIGTAYVPETMRAAIRQRLTPNLAVTYGTNEAGNLTWAGPATLDALPGTVGFPYPGITVEIVDEAGRVLAPGEVGDIRLRADGFPSAYIDDAEASARNFRDGWFWPGDLGLLSPEGALSLRGRVDDMMICDGINIYPVEIEAALLDHPAVVEAAAFPLTGPRGLSFAAAVVVLREPLAPEALMAFCDEQLGLRAPRAIYIRPTLPRGSLGKVLKRQLIEELSGGGVPSAE